MDFKKNTNVDDNTIGYFERLQEFKKTQKQLSDKNKKLTTQYLDSGCDKDDKKDFKGAIEDYTKAIVIDPDYSDAYANRGCAKEELGDKAGAIGDWEKASSLGDDEAAQWIKELVNKIDIRGEELIPIIMNDPDFPKIIYNAGDNRVGRDKIMEFVNERLSSLGVTRPITVSCVTESIIQSALKVAHNNFNKTKQKIEERGEEWQLAGLDLIFVSKRFTEKTIEELATLCGYYSTESYLDSVEEAKAINIIKGDQLYHHEDSYYIYENRLVRPDSEHAGDVYVPKRLIEDDPEFYNINDFQEVTKAFLAQDELMDENEIDELLSQFDEPMMATYISALCFLDGEFLDDDESELQLQGVKLEDVFDLGGLSRWHDG